MSLSGDLAQIEFELGDFAGLVENGSFSGIKMLVFLKMDVT